MKLLQTFFEVTSWCLFIYILVTIIVSVVYWRSKKANFKLRQKIEKWVSKINSVFVIWFVPFTVNELILTGGMNRVWGFEPVIDTGMWVMALSAVLFIFIIYKKKFRKSPYSMIGISIIILINFMIAYSGVAIVV